MGTATGYTTGSRARKVIGTSVKDRSGRRLGAIEDIVLDRLTPRYWS